MPNLTLFNFGYKKSDCQQAHVGKCFTLEDQAIGTVPIYLTYDSGKTHPESVSELRFMIQSYFICLFCQSSYFSKTLNHPVVLCSNPFLLSTVSPHFNTHLCHFCRKFGCIYLLRLISEVTMRSMWK